MKTVFADTSYFIAMLSEDDEMHAAAHACRSERMFMVTTEWVMSELAAYLSDPQNRDLFTQTLQTLQSAQSVELIAASHETFLAGARLYADRPDKQWSLVDCISFSIMRQRGLSEALSSDRHFEQAGFAILLK